LSVRRLVMLEYRLPCRVMHNACHAQRRPKGRCSLKKGALPRDHDAPSIFDTPPPGDEGSHMPVFPRVF
jgi:hypothetical protein